MFLQSRVFTNSLLRMDHGARSGGRADAPETEYQTPIHQVHTTFATSTIRKTLSSKAWDRRHPSALTGPPSKISSAGIAPSHAWPSAELWFCDTGTSWRVVDLHRPRSTSGWRPVRRLAYEASDNGLLNPDLAAGIRRVKWAKRLGMRLGKWLTSEQSRKLLSSP
jgi:hypothetical protein